MYKVFIDNVPKLYQQSNEKGLLDAFKSFKFMQAAGGLVEKEGKYLFIKRNGLWDIPKGKLEKGESIEEGAVREVEEETGVKGLTITKPLPTTYHIFKRNRRYKIKITYWFEMYTSYDGELLPEASEGITKVKWLGKKKQAKALKNSYANIRELL